MSEKSREMAREHGQKSEKGRELISKLLERFGDESDE